MKLAMVSGFRDNLFHVETKRFESYCFSERAGASAKRANVATLTSVAIDNLNENSLVYSYKIPRIYLRQFLVQIWLWHIGLY